MHVRSAWILSGFCVRISFLHVPGLTPGSWSRFLSRFLRIFSRVTVFLAFSLHSSFHFRSFGSLTRSTHLSLRTPARLRWTRGLVFSLRFLILRFHARPPFWFRSFCWIGSRIFSFCVFLCLVFRRSFHGPGSRSFSRSLRTRSVHSRCLRTLHLWVAGAWMFALSHLWILDHLSVTSRICTSFSAHVCWFARSRTVHADHSLVAFSFTRSWITRLRFAVALTFCLCARLDLCLTRTARIAFWSRSLASSSRIVRIVYLDLFSSFTHASAGLSFFVLASPHAHSLCVRFLGHSLVASRTSRTRFALVHWVPLCPHSFYCIADLRTRSRLAHCAWITSFAAVHMDRTGSFAQVASFVCGSVYLCARLFSPRVSLHSRSHFALAFTHRLARSRTHALPLFGQFGYTSRTRVLVLVRHGPFSARFVTSHGRVLGSRFRLRMD